MTATIELNSARRKLSTALGEASTKEYFFQLKSWFRKRISKEEFDTEARKLLAASNQTHLHNEFLLAILNKCQTLANISSPSTVIVPSVTLASPPISIAPPAHLVTPKLNVGGIKIEQQQMMPQLPSTLLADGKYELQQQMLLRQAEATILTGHHSPSGGVLVMGSDRVRKGKVKRKGTKSGRPSFDQRFQPAAQPLPPTGLHEDEAAPPREEEKQLRYCYREPAVLPDIGLIHGRMLVCAWEERLEGGVDNDAVKLMAQAVESQLRRLVMALVMRRKPFRMQDGRFPHAVGVPRPNPWLFNMQKRRRRDVDAEEEVVEPLEAAGQSANNPDLEPMLAPAARLAYGDAEQRALYEATCAVDDGNSELVAISPFDLLAVLQERRSVLPCHTVYAVNVERVIARLHHRGHDDLAQWQEYRES